MHDLTHDARRRALLARAAAGIGGAALGAVAPTAAAQDAAAGWPSKPIRWIVPYPPGGITDLLARAVGQKLAEAWGQPVVIENRAGAGSNIGNEFVARSDPDGYTLLTATPPVAINPTLMAGRLRYDPLGDLAPVVQLVDIPNAVFVPANSPMRTLPELIAYARANPGRLSYGSSGIGTVNHLGGELLKAVTKTSIAYVPYKGSAPLMQDLAGGQLPMAVDNLGTLWPLVGDGRVRALAVLQPERVPSVPQVPATGELGLPEVVAVGWQGVSVRTGTPVAIVEKLAREIDRILRLPDVKARFEPGGNTLRGGTPEAFGRWIRAEADKWGRIIRDNGIQPE
jgi:tripartite-type tricarboxylate transporter receptor subunit TctC